MNSYALSTIFFSTVWHFSALAKIKVSHSESFCSMIIFSLTLLILAMSLKYINYDWMFASSLCSFSEVGPIIRWLSPKFWLPNNNLPSLLLFVVVTLRVRLLLSCLLLLIRLAMLSWSITLRCCCSSSS
jgi:hypothetical protein